MAATEALVEALDEGRDSWPPPVSKSKVRSALTGGRLLPKWETVWIGLGWAALPTRLYALGSGL